LKDKLLGFANFMYGDEVIMKKLIQICSLLSLVLVFTAVSASAHTAYGSEVEIPFSFSAGDRSYEAGKYIVKVATIQNGTAAITIVDPKSDSTQTVLARRSGDTADNEIKLVFNNVNGERVLSRIITPTGGFAFHPKNQRRDVARQPVAAPTAFIGSNDLF
jgi:hypothetical protein